MFKVYKAKCEPLGINAWDYHTEQMKENHLLWGVAKLNNAVDDDYKSFNYQYLQALQLENADIDELCKQTEDFLRSLNSGDIETVYNNLLVNGGSYSAEVMDDENDTDESVSNSNYKKLFHLLIEKEMERIGHLLEPVINKSKAVKFQEETGGIFPLLQTFMTVHTRKTITGRAAIPENMRILKAGTAMNG